MCCVAEVQDLHSLQRQAGLITCRNYNTAFIEGSSNLRISAVKDHSHSTAFTLIYINCDSFIAVCAIRHVLSINKDVRPFSTMSGHFVRTIFSLR